MAAYKRILIAVDLSADSAFVFDKAREFGAHQAELSLVHVMEPLPVSYAADMAGINFQQIYAESMRENRGKLLELGGVTGIPEYRLHTIVGYPPREIRNLAQKLNADLIVVGGHGKHGLELLLGSTSTAVAHGVDCDLLIVRVPKPEAACSK